MFPILNPPPSSLPIPSLWGVPVRQPQASRIVHRTWTGDSFHIRYFTCFNAILPNHPTLSLSHRVQKTVLYMSVSFAVLYTGLLLPSFASFVLITLYLIAGKRKSNTYLYFFCFLSWKFYFFLNLTLVIGFQVILFYF